MITRQYLPAFSQLISVIFDLKNCVELPQSRTKRLPGAPFIPGEIHHRIRKTLVDILAKKKKKSKVEKNGARGKRCRQTRAMRITCKTTDKNRSIELENQGFASLIVIS